MSESTRPKKLVDVELKATDGSWNPCTESPFKSTAQAERWLLDNGENGKTYRIIKIEREHTLNVIAKRVASLT